jgi:catechol 2,3-dioxygenase-like lactoylglutathione lyase family enzyme
MLRTPVVLYLVVLRARDLKRAEDFYRALGMEFIRHSHGHGPMHLSTETAGQVFELYPLGENEIPTTSTRIGFAVASVDDTYQALLIAGGSSVSSPRDSQWGRRAVVSDPDGHRVEITTQCAGFDPSGDE